MPRGSREGNETHVLYDLARLVISGNAHLLHGARKGAKIKQTKKTEADIIPGRDTGLFDRQRRCPPMINRRRLPALNTFVLLQFHQILNDHVLLLFTRRRIKLLVLFCFFPPNSWPPGKELRVENVYNLGREERRRALG